MLNSKWMRPLAVAAATFVAVETAAAQGTDAYGIPRSSSVATDSSVDGDARPANVMRQASLSSGAQSAECAADSAPSCDCGQCDSCCRRGLGLFDECCPLECPEADPWQLFKCFNDNECGRTITGFVEGGGALNTRNPATNYNGPVGFADRTDFTLNQFYLTVEQALTNDGCGFGWGGRVDTLYGTDARFTDARGLELNTENGAKWNQASPFYGLAMPQAYLQLGYNDLSVKIGHFYTIIGYEVVPANGNFFYTHAYTMMYGEPFTHTGALATYALNENVSLSAGIDRGWDNWDDDMAHRANYLGGITWKNDCGLAVAFSGTMGVEPVTATTFNNRTLGSLVVTKQFNSRWTYVFQHDNGFQEGDGAVENSEWYGINQYLFYKINCCWAAGVRAEWFRDDDGQRVVTTGNQRPGPTNPDNTGGFAGNFYEITLGVNWTPNDNLTVRPEVRFDWYDGTNGPNGAPFDDGTSDNQTLFAVDAILKY